jgi:gliotoxin/aspirochlorine biosynthesis peptide synthetase
MRDTVLQALSEVLQVSLSEIDPDASFTQLGGHSMSAIALKSKCKENGILLSVETILTSPDVSRMVERAIPEPLPQQPVQVEQHLDSRKDIFPAKVNATHPFPVIEKTNIISRNDRSTPPRVLAPDASIIASTTVPMTEMQLSLVHGSQKQPGTNIIYHCETFRPEDIPTMRKAWQTVIEMEPIFRATFELSNGLLVDHPLASFSWTEVSVHDQQLYDTEVEKELQRSTAATRFKVVNLTGRSPQMNLSTIIWGVSHALIDGYSASLVLNKVRQAAAGLPIKPGASFFQVARELGLLRNKLRSDGQEFWRNRLEKFDGAVGELLLPAPLTHASSNAHHTETVAFQLPLEKILEYAQSSQVTMASFYHAAWALTLSMYTDSDTVVFGGVLSGRNLPLPGVESSIGPLVNTLPLHVSLDRAMTCVDYLRKTFVDLVELMSFQWTTPQDGYTRKFSSAMAMQFNVMPDEYDSVVPIAKSYSTTTSDIPLSLLLEADGVVQLRYHSNTYKRSDISMLAENFQNALQALCMPHQTLGVCLQSMLSCGAQENLYRMGNCLSGFTTVRSVQEDLVSLFELVATQYPEGIAVEKGNSRMTYSELNSAANQVAAAISPLIKEGEAVCTHADQSINWIIAIYGILKAKGVYCPLAVTLPAELRNSMYISAGSTLFLTPYSEQRSYQPSSCISCMAVEDVLWSDVSDMDEQLNSLKQPSPRPWATAYLCFTSGSTGKPKGVLCSHEGLVAFQRDLKVRLFSQPGWKIAQIMSPAFDGSIHEIFSALSYGATLVLQSSDDPFEHVQLVDSAILTPSIARVLKPEDFPKLSTVSLYTILKHPMGIDYFTVGIFCW